MSRARRSALVIQLVLAAAAAAAAAPGLTASDFEAVRLVGGRSPRQGRLQVLAAGRWSTSVCHTGDDELGPIARVVCREQGFGGGWPYGGPGAADSDVNPLTGAFACTGNETALAECSGETEFIFGPTDWGCDNPESEYAFRVGVACAGAANVTGVRLSGGPTPTEGRVEVQLDGGAWGSVCTAGHEVALARVACRELGYGDGSGARYRSDAHYGTGSVAPALMVLAATGDERGLRDVGAAVWPSTCSSGHAFGVACNGSAPFEVRLAGGASSAEGRLEVLVNGSWAGVCWSSWPPFLPAAAVACRSLGLAGGSVRKSNFYGASQRLAIGAVSCTGKEASLADCSFAGVTPQGSACLPDDGVGVACEGASTITGLRLTGGPTPAEGRVEVQLAGGSTWGTVEGLVTDTIPSVVCRQLGFGGGAMRGGGMYHAHFLEPHLADEPELPGMLRDVSCSGQEEALSNCSYARERAEMGVIGASLEPLGVACTGARTITGLRLVGPRAALGEGLLQVRLFNTNGSWGTACEYTSWWNEPAAGVACWQLGWQREGAQRVAGSRFADASGLPITFAHVYCSGGEHSLDECSFDLNSPYNPACEHSGDMGLRCQGPKRSQ